MICNYCGYKVSEDCKCCPNCGEDPKTRKKKTQVEKSTKEYDSTTETKNSIEADYSFLWGILGYFIPIVGLILFIVWRESKPKESKAVGIGALIRGIMMFIAFIIMIVLVIYSAIDV